MKLQMIKFRGLSGDAVR